MYNMNTEHDSFGSIPWECTQTVFSGALTRRKKFEHRSDSYLCKQGPPIVGHACPGKDYIFDMCTVPQTTLYCPSSIKSSEGVRTRRIDCTRMS